MATVKTAGKYVIPPQWEFELARVIWLSVVIVFVKNIVLVRSKWVTSIWNNGAQCNRNFFRTSAGLRRQRFVNSPGFSVIWGIFRRKRVHLRWTTQRKATFNFKNQWKFPQNPGSYSFRHTTVHQILTNELEMSNNCLKIVPEKPFVWAKGGKVA